MDEFGKCLGEITGRDRYLVGVVRHMMIESNSWVSYRFQGELILEFRYPTHITYLKRTPEGFVKYREDIE